MKKYTQLFFVLISASAFGQVGINTQNPQNTFHIDGGKDNPITGAPTTLQQANDFIVTNVGQVGISTTIPSQNLDVATGNVRIRDINSNSGVATTDKVVVADASGVLKTIPKQNSLIFGGDFTDVIGPPVLVTSAVGNTIGTSGTLSTVNFNLSYPSLVTFNYSLSYDIRNIAVVSDGITKSVFAGFTFTTSATPSVPTGIFFAGNGVPVSLGGGSNAYGNIPGFYYLTGSQTLKLDAGDYTILLRGSVRNSALSTAPFQIGFGGALNDFITITAQVVQ